MRAGKKSSAEANLGNMVKLASLVSRPLMGPEFSSWSQTDNIEALLYRTLSGVLLYKYSIGETMSIDKNSRRNFLQLSGTGLAGMGLSTALLSRTSALTTGQAGTVPRSAKVLRPFPMYDVRAFGAKGDGKAIDTPAVNKAIDAAA